MGHAIRQPQNSKGQKLDTDYYEVLGIRPNAGADEIELAYRGRRSQYHPDRYATSDPDTLDWATAKMKAVNEAYAALRDPHLRSRFDQEPQQRAPRSEGARNADRARAREPKASTVTLKEVLGGLVARGKPLERIYIAPHIPPRKLASALESYGDDLRPEDVVVLIDDTFFGGAREGVLITEAQIRAKAVFQSADIRLLVPRSEIVADGKHVLINGCSYTKLNLPSEGGLKELFQAVTHYLQHHS